MVHSTLCVFVLAWLYIGLHSMYWCDSDCILVWFAFKLCYFWLYYWHHVVALWLYHDYFSPLWLCVALLYISYTSPPNTWLPKLNSCSCVKQCCGLHCLPPIFQLPCVAALWCGITPLNRTIPLLYKKSWYTTLYHRILSSMLWHHS